jgi:hypothetical protein
MKKNGKQKKQPKKRVEVFLYPNDKVDFTVDGWDITDKNAGLQVNFPEIGKAIHIDFGKKPTIHVYSLDKNGDLWDNTHTIELDKTDEIAVRGNTFTARK